MFFCVGPCACSRTTVNKIIVKQTDSSLQTLNLGFLCSPIRPFLLLFSCQCQRSGSVNRPDGCRTQSPLSLRSFLFHTSHQSSFKAAPPTLFLLFFISLYPPICPHRLLFVSRHSGKGFTILSSSGFCCQDFLKLNFTSLEVVCLVCNSPKKSQKLI